MASISVPCPKASVSVRNASISRHIPSLFVGRFQITSSKGTNSRLFTNLKAQAAPKNASTSGLKTETSNGKVGDGKMPAVPSEVPETVLSAFMTEVSDLVKLVDSRDIIELQLKKDDCELIIRKKEAMPQAAPSQPPPQAMHQLQPQMPSPALTPSPAPKPAADSLAASAPPAPAPVAKASYPPLKCPMAGTFYRCPAPGEPPFVKVGDKVKKGQVVCIIEAMKLMNEIEADRNGTIVDIIAQDGKPVSIDTPLFTVAP